MSKQTPAKTVQTIADVARLAGVSKSTVSRALNDSPLIAAETKERIRAIADDHGFQLNVPAQRLSLKRSNTIAFTTCAHHKDYSVADLFDLELMGGVSSGLYGHGYDLLVLRADPHSADWASQYLDTGRVDGFILLPSTSRPHHIQAMLELRAPFVIWGVPGPRHTYPSVTGDNVSGGRLAAEHLLAAGRRRIAFLGGPPSSLEVQHRYDGYAAALRGAGLEPEQELVAHGNYSDTSGALAMGKLLEQAPDLDAVLVNSDLMAIAAMDELRRQGRDVPGDVSVVGYDDLSIAAHSNPPLTTVRQNVPLAGKLLAENLIEYLETGVVANVVMPVELVVRESA